MAALNTTTYSYALKRLYPQSKIDNLVIQGAGPLYGMLSKNTKFTGAAMHVAVQYGDTIGRSATFSTAQANKAASKGVAFLLTRVKDYSLASIDSETIYASEGNEGALLKATKSQMDSAINKIANSIGRGIYGDGSRSIGTIHASTNLSSTTLQFAVAADTIHIQEGDKLVFAANSTSALRNSGATKTVVSVDRAAGTCVLDEAIDNDSGTDPAAGDAIFLEGDYVSASDRLGISGLAAWVPSSTPAATAFFGVDRTVDSDRLGGIRLDGTSLNLDEAIKKMAATLFRYGARPDVVLMSHSNLDLLTNLLGSKVQYVNHKLGEIGFQSVSVHGSGGLLNVFADHNCPENRVYVLQKDTWEFASLGPAPRILDADGQKLLRESTADALEVRIGFFGNLYTTAPGYNGVISVNVPS